MMSAATIDEARRLAQLLLGAAQRAQSAFAAIAAELTLPVAIARVICQLSEPIALHQLAATMACDKSYITPLADQLEVLGLAIRLPGPNRRSKVLQLTAQGEAMRMRLEAHIAARSPVMTALNEHERDILSDLLAKIVGHEANQPA